MKKERIPHLTLRNEDKFFYGLATGTIFTYPQSFLWEDVVLFAERVGVNVEYNHPSSAEYREFGCFSGKVIEKGGKR